MSDHIADELKQLNLPLDYSSVFKENDRGFIGKNNSAICPLVYSWDVEVADYGYLDGRFDIVRIGSDQRLSVDMSVGSCSDPARLKISENELEDALTELDALVHSLQNFRQAFMESIDAYREQRTKAIARFKEVHNV